MKNYKPSSSRGQPIYDNLGQKVVGYVKGQAFVKEVSLSAHFLRDRHGWAFDVKSLEQAQASGAKKVVLVDKENDVTYTAPIEMLLKPPCEFVEQQGDDLEQCLEQSPGSVESLPGSTPRVMGAAGIDTLAVEFEIQINQVYLHSWEMFTYQKVGRRRLDLEYIKNIYIENGAAIKCTYRPRSFIGKRLLIIEFSLPMLLYGNNIQMVDDIEVAITHANEIISKIPELSQIDIRDGVLFRLDVCCNFQVGELVPYFVKALQAMTYPNRKTMPYDKEGVQYKVGKETTKFYNKEKQLRDTQDGRRKGKQEVPM